MSNKINVLIVEPLNKATFTRIDDAEKIFTSILGGKIKSRVKEISYGDSFKKISSNATNQFILINLDENDEHVNMDLKRAYELLFNTGNMLEIDNIDLHIENEFEVGYFGHKEVKISPAHLDYATEIARIRFDFYEEEDSMLIGKANVVILNQSNFDCNGIRGYLEEHSNPLSKFLKGIDEYETPNLAREFYGGVSGKVAIINELFVGGPFENILEIEEAALQSIIDFFDEEYRVDFLIFNPTLVKFRNSETFIKDEIGEKLGFEKSEDMDNASMVLDIGEQYEIEVDDDFEDDNEEFDLTERLMKDYLYQLFRIKLLERIVVDDDMTLEEKGLMSYYALENRWSEENITEHCEDIQKTVGETLQQLVQNEFLLKKGNEYLLKETLFSEALSEAQKEMADIVYYDDEEHTEFPSEDFYGIKKDGEYGVDYEIQSESMQVVEMDNAYLTYEEYQVRLRPHLVKEMLMSRRMSLNEPLPFNTTPLMAVTFHKDTQMVKSILENFTKEELENEQKMFNEFGQNALSLAVRNNDIEIVDMLLKAGFSIKIKIELKKLGLEDNLFTVAANHNSIDVLGNLIRFSYENGISINEELSELLMLIKQNPDLFPEDIVELVVQHVQKEEEYLKGSRYIFNISKVTQENGSYIFQDINGIELRWGTKTKLEISKENLMIRATIKEQLGTNCFEVLRVNIVS